MPDSTPKPTFWTDGPAPSNEAGLASTQVRPTLGPVPFNIAYFDLEIREDPDIIGWDECVKRGGISIACLLDEFRSVPRFFDDKTLADGAVWLENAAVLVTFNGTRFDLPLVENHLGRSLTLKSHIDLFLLVKQALSRAGKGWRGHGLDALCRNSLGEGKIGSGAQAPRLAAEGRWAELVSYCLSDVLLTQKLCTFIRWNGYVIDKDGDTLYLDIPRWFRMRDFEQPPAPETVRAESEGTM